jgi:hypothetical protein
MIRFLTSLVILLPLGAMSCGGDTDDGDSDASGVTVCSQLVSKLESCNLAQRSGATCSGYTFDDEHERCVMRCMAQAQCVTLRSLLCNDGQYDPNDRALNCILACNQQRPTFQCADGSGQYTENDKCDYFEDCDDASDEANCPVFQCGDGREILEADKCDGFPDCLGGEDEEGCPEGRDAPVELTCG